MNTCDLSSQFLVEVATLITCSFSIKPSYATDRIHI